MIRGEGAVIFRKYVLPRINYAMKFIYHEGRIEFCNAGIKHFEDIKKRMKTPKPRSGKCHK